jgi:Tol biopolymer transport system component
MPDDKERGFQIGLDGELKTDFLLEADEKPKRGRKLKPLRPRNAVLIALTAGILVLVGVAVGFSLAVVAMRSTTSSDESAILPTSTAIYSGQHAPTPTPTPGLMNCATVVRYGGDKLVVHTTSKDFHSALYVVHLKTGAMCQALPDNVQITYPTWSPDGKKVAFGAYDSAGTEHQIFVMNLDGSNARQLSFNGLFSSDPAWSPDSSQISFTSKTSTGIDMSGTGVFVVDVDAPVDVNAPVYSTVSDARLVKIFKTIYGKAAWSADGTRLALSGHPLETDNVGDGKDSQILVVNIDGTNLTRLTGDDSFGRAPGWSLDGHRLAFNSRDGAIDTISVVNADGSADVPLPTALIAGSDPVWSPIGTQIAYVSRTADGNSEIYVMDTVDFTPRRLTNTASNEMLPAWSPDGTRILFLRKYSETAKLFIINTDGSDEHLASIALDEIVEGTIQNFAWLP